MRQNFQKYIEEYLFFSRRERRGLFVLLIIVLLICLFSRTIPKWINNDESVTLDVTKIKEGDSSVEENESYIDKGKGNYYSHKKRWTHDDPSSSNATSLFEFNPNTADADTWKRLGIKESVVQTIFKYREKGGRFKKPEDLRRIFGLSQALCDKLIPYVHIPEPDKINKESNAFPKREKQIINVNINKSGIEDWNLLQGIGEGYARRIINYREKLGGFYSIEQVGETYGLPDSVFQKIKSKLVLLEGPYRLINLNLIETDELKKHPYVNFNLAKIITAYRSQHGAFQSVEDLKRIGTIDAAQFQKLFPYLAVK